jgi:Fe-S-cluster-containing dehydrogenase component
MTAGFVLDLHRCVGCGACVLACRIENRRLSSAPWRRVIPLNLTRRPGGPTYFFSVACHHCESPACLAGCPARAFEQRADGIVVHHEDQCLGCRYCEMTCPFGAPQFDADRGVISKCHFCVTRADRGLPPACVAACPTAALQTTEAAENGWEPACGEDPSDNMVSTVPGFVDPAGCSPRLRFRLPGGRQRTARFRALQEKIAR